MFVSDIQNKANSKPPEDYIHVRARRDQATDSHSLVETVRITTFTLVNQHVVRFEEKKIGERMKLLQDLVPGCNTNRQIFDKTDASGRVYGMVWVYRVGIKFSII
ncbi:hypothetical protein NC653_006046 [Populus alba x Populus x berolinensis]|uniref:Uncharacterized protein n=1 Tax=Populus alba x Populus x berolinensis TaxID=444605 RepID=A0AAD6RDE9_9ROSI|nr:hypothetical protein NC653_006046 [Populus alba x Populus x berolinensis]